MFPLRALPQVPHPPWVTRMLAALCVLVGVWQWLIGAGSAIGQYGARPYCYLMPASCGYDVLHSPVAWLTPLFLSLFLHASFSHLAFNVWFLWVFGPAVEEKFGRLRFLCFYILGGLAASAAHILFNLFSPTPVIGASGAIAAVLGASFVLAPRGWVLSYVPPFWVFPIPSPLFLALWLATQIWGVLGSWFGAQDNTAWLAHVGGFAFGAWWAWHKTKRKKAR